MTATMTSLVGRGRCVFFLWILSYPGHIEASCRSTEAQGIESLEQVQHIEAAVLPLICSILECACGFVWVAGMLPCRLESAGSSTV